MLGTQRKRLARLSSIAAGVTTLAAIASVGLATPSSPAGADPSGGGPAGATASSPASDSSLVLTIAHLTDQIRSVEERIASDRIRSAVDTLELHQAEQAVRADAVDAYVSGGRTAELTFFVPSPVPLYYTDLVLQDQQNLVARLRRDQSQAARDEKADQSDYKTLSFLQADLDQQRAALEARVSLDASLAVQLSDTRARAAVLARQSLEQSAPGGTAPGGSALSATERQQSEMSKYPFGPLSASQLASAGLVETGQTISGIASWYGPGFDGRPTASGAIYDENGWTCASRTLAFGTMLLVTAGSASVLIQVNDRGPYVAGRVLDLSHAAAQALGSTGLINVVAYVVAPS